MSQQVITYNSGKTVVVDVIPADIVEFERRYGAMDLIEVALTEHSLYLPYCATVRTSRKSVGSFSRWMERVANIDAVE